MPDTVLPKPAPEALDNLLRRQAEELRVHDAAPADRAAWERRRADVRTRLLALAGTFPKEPCPLQDRVVGTLPRDGYRIEKVVFQSRPDVWVTASAYVPAGSGKHPAVLVVHGHWRGARRDPVVQARCLGLVKLGFFVLAVDAFGAGERFVAPAPGTYHGALFGATLWPVGQTLLGMQVYDNRRAVDYLQSRPEVDGDRLGVTGASGGGNQTMYAGAFDDRFGAVVPVCSVGTYQSYLRAACCVCEVLPGALRVAEEGEVLGLVAPRALLVINATRDAFQFSVGEAARSVARAKPIFEILGAGEKLRHTTFESPHDYNQAMREAMYGWMTRWLKNEGDGRPIPEPKHDVETWEALACFPDPAARPKGFLFPPTFAAREAAVLAEKQQRLAPNHVEAWESTAVHLRDRLRQTVFGDFPKPHEQEAVIGATEADGGSKTTPIVLYPEPEMPLPVLLRRREAEGRRPLCALLHLDGKAEALKHPMATALLDKGWAVAAPDLRGIGETAAGGAIGGAPDHNPAEHALWIGRSLLGQWVHDVRTLLTWLHQQSGYDDRRLAVVGIGQAGLVALCTAALLDPTVTSAALVDAPLSYAADAAYPPGTRMGLLAPGLLQVGDVPLLAALAAPRRLVIAGGTSARGDKLSAEKVDDGFDFTQQVYKVHRAAEKLVLLPGGKPEAAAAAL